jgi:hypothetical protein
VYKFEWSCDRCKKVAELKQDRRPEQFFRVTINLEFLSLYPSPKRGVKSGDWCRSCAEEFGLVSLVERKEEKPPVEVKTSIEDLIREIVREEVQE